MDVPYLGRFSADQIAPVLEAAAPIPSDPFEYHDEGEGRLRTVSRSEAIVRRLEYLDALVQMDVQHQSDVSPSELAKRAHAIVSAAQKLLGALGVDHEGHLESVQRQLRNGLRSTAERHGERSRGFAHHPPTAWQMAGEQFMDFHGDSQLRDNIEAVIQLRDWAKDLEASARHRVNGSETSIKFAERVGIEPWDGEPVTDAIAGILRIWVEILERNIRTAVKDGVAYGRLERFTLACLRTLNATEGVRGKPLDTDAIRSRIRRMVARGFEKSSSGH